MFSYLHPIVQKDLEEIASSSILNFKKLENKTILVTGVNGMLATYITYTLLYHIEHFHQNIRVLALTRSIDKTNCLFEEFLDKDYFEIVHQDICAPIKYMDRVDYIFHFAGNASPYYINHQPVDILRSNLEGTFNIMELARKNERCKVIFASTREVYGKVDEDSLSENSFGSLDPLDNRSCYPESKRAAETIIRSYFLQYGVDTTIARIAHSYGPGMKIVNDGRVMADFIGNAVRHENIVLNSSGEAVRAFLYLSDATIALFKLAFDGQAGEAYNLSNETEPYPIYQVAQMICEISKDDIQVIFSKDKPKAGYCNYPRVALDNSKIAKLGFLPQVNLKEGLMRTLNSFES